MELKVSIKKNLSEFTLDMDVHVAKECIGLMGPSGSGKSMFLKCIAGIETPDQGRIQLDDQILFDSQQKINLSPQKREIGYLFQGYALFPNMTVEKNIETGLKAKGLPKDLRKEKVAKIMEQIQISNLSNRSPDQLSGGQKQRTALARLLVYEPKVLLFDEPCSALDASLKEEIYPELKAILDAMECPAILVSHDEREVQTLCKKYFRIERGML